MKTYELKITDKWSNSSFEPAFKQQPSVKQTNLVSFITTADQ